VAWDGGRPVGDVYLSDEPPDEPEVREWMPGVPMLVHLEVVPARQNQGIGTALIAAAEDEARARGHQTACIGVGVANHDALRLYERLGYVDWENGTVRISWVAEDGTPESDEVHMLVKLLTPGVPGLDRWDAWRPGRAAEILAGCAVPWCVAAGWAIELFAGRPTRPHGDMEIAIPRADLDELRPYLAGYELREMGDHQVWVFDRVADAWRMDIFLEPGDRETWVSHRDPRITRPLAEAVARADGGIPYLRPELVLFTKAKRTRPKDQRDFEVVAPLLDAAARGWLAGALELAHPDHPWLDRLG